MAKYRVVSLQGNVTHLYFEADSVSVKSSGVLVFYNIGENISEPVFVIPIGANVVVEKVG